MRMLKLKYARDGGWTLMEAIISVVVMTIMLLGLTIVLMAFREHLDRSWAIRVMDQYGNDAVERLSHQLRNAVDVTVRRGTGNTHKIDIKFLDPYLHDQFRWEYWRADVRTARILVNNEPLDPTFPPRQPGRGESYQIVQFTMTPYGALTPNQQEHQDSYHRSESFLTATYDLRFKLRYLRQAINPGERNWSYEKEYFNRVYMRNKNLIIKKGVTE